MINGNLILYFFSQTPLLNIPSRLCWTVDGDSELVWVVDRCDSGDTWIIEC